MKSFIAPDLHILSVDGNFDIDNVGGMVSGNQNGTFIPNPDFND